MDSKMHPNLDGAGGEGQAELEARRRAFGQRMRNLREEHGVSVDALAATTRIGFSFIEAIELGNLDKLPGRVFARGFVQSILRHFGADPAPLLNEFRELWEQPASSSSVLKVQIKNKPVKQRSDSWVRMTTTASSLVRRGILIKIVAPVAAFAFVIYLLASHPQWRTVWQGGRGSGANIAAVKAKPLDLRVRSEEPAAKAPIAPQLPLASPKGDPVPVAVPSSEPPVNGSAAVSERPLLEASRWSATSPGEATLPTGRAVAGAEPSKATHVEVPVSTGASGEQVLILTVSEPVRIRLDVDHGQSVTKELAPDTYRFTFSQKADVMVYDASAVKISFNGRPLGSLGGKGRVRRLSFQTQAQPVKAL